MKPSDAIKLPWNEWEIEPKFFGGTLQGLGMFRDCEGYTVCVLGCRYEMEEFIKKLNETADLIWPPNQP
jgi:hypothetical protein